MKRPKTLWDLTSWSGAVGLNAAVLMAALFQRRWIAALVLVTSSALAAWEAASAYRSLAERFPSASRARRLS